MSTYNDKTNNYRNRCKEHGIEPVEYAAVAGKEPAHILDSAAALDGALKQITYLRKYGRRD